MVNCESACQFHTLILHDLDIKAVIGLLIAKMMGKKAVGKVDKIP